MNALSERQGTEDTWELKDGRWNLHSICSLALFSKIINSYQLIKEITKRFKMDELTLELAQKSQIVHKQQKATDRLHVQ